MIRLPAISTVLFLSDLHVGRKTDDYNLRVFCERMDTLQKKFNAYKTMINRSYKMPDLHIVFLGDILDGETIYPAQAFNLDSDVDTAMDVLLDKVSAFILSMLDRFEEIHIYGVEGNHGRTHFRGKTNWDKIFYKRLKDRFLVIDRVKFHLGSWYLLAQIRSKKMLFVHGDQINMYQNIPLYGIIQKGMRWYSGGIEEPFDIVALGHFHTVFMMDWNNIRIFGNGTFITSDDYVKSKVGMKSQNRMWVLGIGDDDLEFMHTIEVA